MRWDIAILSEPGERENNEDCVAVTSGDAGICAVLCDGLGGHDAGEVASKCVCDSVTAAFEKTPEGSRAAESIAADVARDDEVLVLCHRIEEAAVRAAGAESGRTGHGSDADVHGLRFLAEDALAH